MGRLGLRFTRLCVFALLVATGWLASCRSTTHVSRTQDLRNAQGAVYYLPRHSLSLRFRMAVRQTVPGPYAEYAEELLGIDWAPRERSTQYAMASVQVETHVEPDLDYAFSMRGRDSVALLRLSEHGHLFPANAVVGRQAWRRRVGLDRPEGGQTDLSVSPFVGKQENTFYQVLQNDTAFVRVPVQRSMNVKLPRDQKAKQAAEFIFSLRKKRYDLIAGDVDLSNTAQGTLPTMLEEITRLETAYLQLFVGRTQVDTVDRVVEFVPSVGTSMVIPCRFSPERGIVSPREMNARPVVVTCVAEREEIDSGRSIRPLENALYYRPAAPVNYSVTWENREWLSGRLFLYQYGTVIPLSIPKPGKRKSESSSSTCRCQ